VVGSPISHSRSPVLHRAAYAALGLTEWRYERVELTGRQLPGWLSGLDRSWRGVSVTMPGKLEALACADTASDLAVRLGAANTLVRSDAGWHADNTDVAGLLGALGEHPTQPGPGTGRATVVGAGATASAAVAALAALGHGCVDVVVRDPARAQNLLGLIEGLGMTGELHPWPGISRRPGPLNADLVISTVPGTATGDLLGQRWRHGQTIVDVSYDPWPTALVQAAAAGGARAIGGATVLLWQAVGQLELMTGRPAPVEAMREALLPGGSLVPA